MCREADRGKDAPFFSETTMAASSVTGTGPGESFGKQKPELHSGCGCCAGGKPKDPRPARRRVSCVREYSSSAPPVRYSHSSPSVRVGSCI